MSAYFFTLSAKTTKAMKLRILATLEREFPEHAFMTGDATGNVEENMISPMVTSDGDVESAVQSWLTDPSERELQRVFAELAAAAEAPLS